MKVAIIDDGVHSGQINIPKLLGSYLVLPNGQVELRQMPQYSLSHGTICASILGEICRDIELIDIKILSHDRKASIDALVTALTWCYENSIKLINMSLGTLNYHDYCKMTSVINKLLVMDTVIVSAYHNMNLITYPASVPGVFGVRIDRTSKLKEEEFAIEVCDGLLPENCFVASYGKPLMTFSNEYISTEMSNSFAAPVITGHVSNFLNKHERATLAQVFAYLRDNAKPYTNISNKICSYINADKWPIQSVVIGAGLSLCNKLSGLQVLFEANGYYIETFSTSKTGAKSAKTIPLSCHHMQQRKIDRNILYTLDFIYKPDVIIIFLNEDDCCIDWNVWDAFIKGGDSAFIVAMEDQCSLCDALEDLFNTITGYFQKNASSRLSIT